MPPYLYLVDSSAYFQISHTGQALIKDRASKFYAYAFPCEDLAQLENKLLELKKAHPTARHFCWASRMNRPLEERANDAGEPAYSAGTPILHALQSAMVEQSAVVVVRYFGGTKLGVPGLITAYRQAAEMAIQDSGTIEVHPMAIGRLTVPYPLIGATELHLRQLDAQIIDQRFGDACAFTIQIKCSYMEDLKRRLQPFNELQIEWAFPNH